MTEEKQDAQEAPDSTPIIVSPEEASTNFYWTLGQHEVFNIQTTIRGNPGPDEIAEHLQAAIDAMKAVVTLGGHAKPVGRQADAGQSAPSPTSAIPAEKTPNAPPLKGGTLPNAVAGPEQIHELRFTKIEVSPKPDGKAELRFYEVGHKYPDIYATRSVEKWMDELGWDETAFVTAAYDVKGVVGYVLSDKLNSKGNPYKDIEFVKING